MIKQGLTYRSYASQVDLAFSPFGWKRKARSNSKYWHITFLKYKCTKCRKGIAHNKTNTNPNIRKGASMKETIAIQFCKQNNKVPAKSLRTHCVSVRFNQDELKLLNKKRGGKSKGEWLRLASPISFLCLFLPSTYKPRKSLAEISQNLNNLICHLNTKSSGGELTKTEIFAIKRQISELRSCLTASDLPSGK